MIAREVLRQTGILARGTEAEEKLPSFAWPGGYPLYYLCADGGILCPDCANGDDVAQADADDKQWHVTGVDVHWEGQPLTCDHCNGSIESAYGDPEQSECE